MARLRNDDAELDRARLKRRRPMTAHDVLLVAMSVQHRERDTFLAK